MQVHEHDVAEAGGTSAAHPRTASATDSGDLPSNRAGWCDGFCLSGRRVGGPRRGKEIEEGGEGVGKELSPRLVAIIIHLEAA